MTNKFAPTYRSLESSNYSFGSYMTNGRQRVNERRREKVVAKQPFASLSKSQFTAILRVLSQNRIDLVISNEL